MAAVLGLGRSQGPLTIGFAALAASPHARSSPAPAPAVQALCSTPLTAMHICRCPAPTCRPAACTLLWSTRSVEAAAGRCSRRLNSSSCNTRVLAALLCWWQRQQQRWRQQEQSCKAEPDACVWAPDWVLVVWRLSPAEGCSGHQAAGGCAQLSAARRHLPAGAGSQQGELWHIKARLSQV